MWAHYDLILLTFSTHKKSHSQGEVFKPFVTSSAELNGCFSEKSKIDWVIIKNNFHLKWEMTNQLRISFSVIISS